MSAYTEADVLNAWTSPGSITVQEIRAVLDAVAPAIVARAKAEALREAAGAIFNGATDPEQEFYDVGVSPWLMRRADEIERGQ